MFWSQGADRDGSVVLPLRTAGVVLVSADDGTFSSSEGWGAVSGIRPTPLGAPTAGRGRKDLGGRRGPHERYHTGRP